METNRNVLMMMLGICIALLACDYYLLSGQGRKIGVSAVLSSAKSVGLRL